MQRKGDFFFTHSGIQFWPLDPHPDEINIEDIAHGLAHTCRFGGHCREFYSVCQHSILVSYNVPLEHQLAGLLHDATEAYLGDMIRPLKRNIDVYRNIEAQLWNVIALKFGLPFEMHESIKDADNRALMTERRDLMHADSLKAKWSIDGMGYEPFASKIYADGAHYTKQVFLYRFRELTGEL